MKDLKKPNIVRIVFFFATVLLGLTAVASAQNDATCSATSVAGQWGYSETGTVFTPHGPVPYSSLGRYTLDRNGNYSGSRTATLGGTIQKATFTGQASVNADCTGTVTINFYDPSSGALQSTVVKALVYVDDSRAARAIVTSVTLANGTSVATVLTTDANKMFSNNEQ